MSKTIALSKGLFAIVDDPDFANLNTYKWHASVQKHTTYAQRTQYVNGHKQGVLMHRFILGFPPGVKVDHVNGNGLDNRRENLRQCTTAQNMWNCKKLSKGSSHFKGVFWVKAKNKWRVKVRTNGKATHVGYFADELEAAKAYDRAAIELHKSFARTNFQ